MTVFQKHRGGIRVQMKPTTLLRVNGSKPESSGRVISTVSPQPAGHFNVTSKLVAACYDVVKMLRSSGFSAVIKLAGTLQGTVCLSILNVVFYRRFYGDIIQMDILYVLF